MKNKKLKQLIAVAIVSATVWTMYPIPVEAEWIKDSQNNWNWTENGNRVTGWKQVKGIWYYFDSAGNMKTGWVQTLDSNWYYMNSDGSMKTGWMQDTDGKWYNLASDGAMRTGWMQEANGTWYFANSSGAMETGIIEVDGKTYVLADSGAMLRGNITIGGKIYTTDQSGAITGDKPPSQNKQFTKEGVIITPNTPSNLETPTTTDTVGNAEDSASSKSSSSSNSSSSSSGNGSSSSSRTITSNEILGVTPPVTGAIPVSKIDSRQYTATVLWSGNPTTFAENTGYTATIIITPKRGYKLKGVTENFFTVDGATTVTNSINSGIVTAVFPETEAIVKETPEEDVEVSATPVNPGQTLSASKLSGTFINSSNELVSGTLTWEDETQKVDETGDFDWIFMPIETDKYNEVTGTVEVTTTAAVIITTPDAVSVINVTSEGNATTLVNGERLQMNASVIPANAKNQTIVWSVSTLTGGTAIIDSSTGLLTATGVGTVRVKATNVASGVIGTKDITVVQSLSEAKTAAHQALITAYATYTETDYTTEKWAILTGFKTNGDTAIDAATDLAGVTTAETTAINGMAGVKTIVQTLAEAKVAAHGNLQAAYGTYTETDYEPPNWTTLKGFKTAGDTAIDAATDVAGVTTAENAAINGMAGVKTILADAKAAAHGVLTTTFGTYTANKYTPTNWSTLIDFRSTGDAEIDAATNVAGVTAAQTKATNGMASVETIAQTANIEIGKVPAAQAAYLNINCGTSALDLVYTDVTTAKNALDTAIASNVTANVVSKTTTLKNKLEALSLETISLAAAHKNWDGVTVEVFETAGINGVTSSNLNNLEQLLNSKTPANNRFTKLEIREEVYNL